MLLSLTGASGTGKSTVLAALGLVDWGRPVVCIEFDSIGVPAGADTAWRHEAIEQWVRFAADAQNDGKDVLLCGQVPPGELLAAPSADQLNGLGICVLHCSPAVQESRLVGRGEPAEGLIHHLRFGEWFVKHARDPTHAPEVIRVSSTVPMAWERWEHWESGDPRWSARIVETDLLSPEEVAGKVEHWARGELARHAQEMESNAS